MTDLIKIMPFTPYAEKLTRYFDRMAPAIHELLTTEEFGGSPKFIARCDAEFETWRHVGRAPTREAYGTAFDGWTGAARIARCWTWDQSRRAGSGPIPFAQPASPAGSSSKISNIAP